MEKQYVQKKAKASQLNNKAAENRNIKKSLDKPTPLSHTDNSNSSPSISSQSSSVSKSDASAISSQPTPPPQTSLSTHAEKTENKEEKQEKDIIKNKKEEAIAKGLNFHASKKHCMSICSYIKGKSIEQAIQQLQEVIKMKRPIPFKGEIPHRRGKGIMSGRYPIKASAQFIYLLKALRGNTITNGLELEKTRIVMALANWASRPQKRGGARFKRTNVLLKAKEVNSENKMQMKKTKNKNKENQEEKKQ